MYFSHEIVKCFPPVYIGKSTSTKRHSLNMNQHSSQQEKFRTGNSEVLNDLFDQCYDHLYSYALHVLKSPNLASTVVEDSFVEFWGIREFVDLNTALNDQLFALLESNVFKLFKSAAANKDLGDEIWNSLKELRSVKDDPSSSKTRELTIKVIHNNFLRHQLPHLFSDIRKN